MLMIFFFLFNIIWVNTKNNIKIMILTADYIQKNILGRDTTFTKSICRRLNGQKKNILGHKNYTRYRSFVNRKVFISSRDKISFMMKGSCNGCPN